MEFSDLSSQGLDEQLRIYRASPEGDIRPEIHAIETFRLASIDDLNGRIHVSSIEGYNIANLFWDLYQSDGLIPQFAEDLLESLDYHVLLSSEVWSLEGPWPDSCRQWLEGMIHRLQESLKAISEPPVHADWRERSDRNLQVMLRLSDLHDTEHIRFQSQSRSDEDCDKFIIEFLEWLYDQCKVLYELDGESNSFFELETFLHVAALRAFFIRRKQGLSEVVEECLTDVEHTVARIEAVERLTFPYGEEIIAPCHSTQAVTSLAYVELSHHRGVNNRSVEALHYLARAAKYYDFVAIANSELMQDSDYMRFLYDDRFDSDSQLRRKLEAGLPGLPVSLVEADRIFGAIKENATEDVNWNQVAEDCMALQTAWFVTGREDDIKNDRGYIVIPIRSDHAIKRS